MAGIEKWVALTEQNNRKENWSEGRVMDFIARANIRETALGTGYAWAHLNGTKNSILRLSDDDFLDLIDAEVEQYREKCMKMCTEEKIQAKKITTTGVGFTVKGTARIRKAAMTLDSLGVPSGAELTSSKGSVIAESGNMVRLPNGQIVSLSTAVVLMGGPEHHSGYKYFSYNGIKLKDLTPR